MIRLTRPAAPKRLLKRGYARAQVHCDLFDASPQHRSGEASMPFDAALYNDLSVRQALARAQHGKCCYCESRSKAFDVEHYRPKAAVRQERGGAELRPGYYWLAYEWTNLLYACVFCNQARRDEYGDPTGKGTLFPLADPARRARSHDMPLAEESPLLLDPYEEDPELHIQYNRSVPRGLTAKGRRTIDVLCLRGDAHLAATREHFRRLENLLEVLLGPAELPGEATQGILEELWRLASDESEYCALTRCALRARGLL